MLRLATQMKGMMNLLLMGLLGIGSVSVYAGDVANSPLERFQEIQKGCARAVEEPLNRAGIPELRECISLLNSFVTSYGSSSLAKNVKNDLPIVPRVNWFDEVIPISDGKYSTDGRANNEPIEVVIRPNTLRTRISQDLATNLNLELGIKIRIGEESSGKEYFTTSINEIQINSLRFQNVVALIDDDLEPDQLIIGSNVLHGLQVKDLGESLSISGGVIQEGSEGELGFSLPVITGLLDQLIDELVVSFEKRMAKSNRTLQLASGIEDIDEYGIKLGLLEDVRKEVKETANAYSEIYDAQKPKVVKVIGNAEQLISETNRKREAFARKLCKQIGRTSSYISTTDSVSQLMAKLEGAYEALVRLEDNFEGTNVVSNLRSSPSYCELSSKQISAELDVAHQYRKAMLCIDEGLATSNYLDRENAFDCALNIFEEIEAQSDQSKLASQIENGSPIDGYTKGKLKDLINIEDEAQDRLANAEELREEAIDEDRLPRRHEMLVEAMEELEAIHKLGAAVNPEYLDQSLKDLRSELVELARTMPIELQLVRIDGGCFVMGAILDDVDAAEDEVRHEVCVEEFQIGIYEVTFDEFDRYSNLKGMRPVDDRGWGRGTRPVINVSYMDAIAYTEWLSEQWGRTYRLPTEAEWEYAARGGQETKFPWGDRPGRNKANCRNCRSEWGGKETAPVGSFDPNGYGIYDMAGNVAERTCSIYRARYDGSERSCQPLDAAGSRVVRGGSWKSHSRNLRISYRYEALEIDKKSRFRGFRIVQENE